MESGKDQEEKAPDAGTANELPEADQKASPPPSSHHPTPDPTAAKDLQVGEILPGLLLGSQHVAHDSEKIQQYDVTHILNVANGVDNIFPEKVTYQNQDIQDSPDFPLVQGLEQAIEFIDRSRESSGCTLVHCNAGISRSASIIVAYLMKKENMTLDEAVAHLQSKRPVARPNAGFMSQLETFYKTLHPELQNKDGSNETDTKAEEEGSVEKKSD